LLYSRYWWEFYGELGRGCGSCGKGRGLQL